MTKRGTNYATFLFVSAALVSSLSMAQPSVKMMADTCAMCHGTDGKSAGSIDKLYGMSSEEFVEEMQEFQREGEGRVMQHIVKGYTPEQIRLLGQYFESLQQKKQRGSK